MDVHTPALAEQVRDLVRQRRIDPRTDAAAVRRAAIDVVTEHEQRSLTGAVRSIDEPDLVVGRIVADVSGFDGGCAGGRGSGGIGLQWQ